jgi:hypothetical protein
MEIIGRRSRHGALYKEERIWSSLVEGNNMELFCRMIEYGAF